MTQKNLIKDILKNISNREFRNQKGKQSRTYKSPNIQHNWCHDHSILEKNVSDNLTKMTENLQKYF